MVTVITRDDFPKLIDHYQYKTAVEVGVGHGVNSMYLLDNSSLTTLHGVDNFSVRSYRKSQEQTKTKLSRYGERFHLMEMDSSAAAKEFADGSLDFVYIDGGHRYKSVRADLHAWYPKVKQGGFFGGHDYIITRGCGVVQAVTEFSTKIKREFAITQEPDGGPMNRSFWLIK